MPGGESVDLTVPEPAVADSGVEENNGRSRSGGFVGDLGAVDFGRAQLSLACDSRMRRASASRRAQATLGCSSTNGRNSHGVSP